MRQWEVLPQRLGLTVATDARLTDITYDDDQIWEVRLGEGERPAIAVQTQYGGRVGLASLVPLWEMADEIIYTHDAYHTAPYVVSFGVNYQHIRASIVAHLTLDVHVWVIDSHHLGLLYQLKNTSDKPLSLRADAFAHVGAGGAELPIGIITLSDSGHGLYLGEIGERHAVVLMDGGHATEGHQARIGADAHLEAGESRAILWVHSAEKTVRESIRLARVWLGRRWFDYLRQVHWMDKAIPRFQTGKPLYDLAMGISGMRLVQSLMPMNDGQWRLVATRQTSEGYRPLQHQRHRGWSWQGYDVHLLWQHGRSLADIAPKLAGGLLDGFVSLQGEDGSIYLPTHPSHPNESILCAPLLAQTARRLVQDDDEASLARLYPALRRFFDFWMGRDLDGDGVPEWQHERQMAYVGFPTFGQTQNWGQGLAVGCVESPDLIAYLIEEAQALQFMAEALNKKQDAKALQAHIDALSDALQTMWVGTHFSYRDRDSHVTSGGEVLLKGGRADVVHTFEHSFDTPQRLLVIVQGGARHQPKVRLQVRGLDAEGREVDFETDDQSFVWQYRRGVYTLPMVLSALQEVRCEGLSRVYTVDVATADYTRLDVHGVMPLILEGIEARQRQVLARLLKDEEHFLRPNGLSIVSKQDVDFDASSATGGGGLWLYWVVRLCEALLVVGEDKLAVDVIKRVLELQSYLLSSEHDKAPLGRFYHSDEALTYGEAYHLAGLLPTSLMMQLMGVRITDGGRQVIVSPEFAWNRSIAVQQFGVSVRRTRKRLTVQFASGKRISQEVPSKTLVLTDPEPLPEPDFGLPEHPERRAKEVQKGGPKRVTIDVTIDEDEPS